MEQLMGTRGTDPRLRADEQPVWPGLFSGLLGSRMGPGEKKNRKKQSHARLSEPNTMRSYAWAAARQQR